MAKQQAFIEIGRRDRTLVITLSRAEVRNALNAGMRRELIEALAGVNEDPSIGAVVITGAGEHAFCAGQDLDEARRFDPAGAREWIAEMRAFFTAIRDLDKPSLAAVNGVAAGAGLQIALLCDIRIGHGGTRMGQPEINAGLASVLGSHLLSLTLGHAGAVELSLTGRLVDGEACHRLGLLHRLVPREVVLATAIEEAEALAAKPPGAMRLTKQRFREVTQAGFDEMFAAGARLQERAYASGEPQAAMARFLARRREKSS